MKSSSKTAGNALFFFLARAVDILGSFVSIVLIARYLGISLFGEYSFIMAFIGTVVPIAYFGLERISIREIARNRGSAKEYIGAMLVARWILSILAIAIAAAGFSFMSIPGRNVIAAAVALASELVWASGSTFLSVFRAFEKMQYETAITLVYKLCYIILIGTVIFLDLGFTAIFVTMAVSNTLRFFISLHLSNTRISRPSFGFRTSLLKFLVMESFLLGLSNIFAIWSVRMSPILLNFIRDSRAVALFQSPMSIVVNMQIIPLSIVMARFPEFSRLGAGMREEFSDLYLKSFNLIFGLGMVASAVTFAFSGEIIRIVFGSEFSEASEVLRILAVACPAIFLTSLNEFMFIAVDRQKDILFLWIGGFALNLMGNFLLLESMGAVGAVISLTIMFYVLFFFQWFFSRRLIDASPMHVLLRPALMIACMFSILYFFKGAGLVLKSLGVLGSLGSTIAIVSVLRTSPAPGIRGAAGDDAPASIRLKGLLIGFLSGPFRATMDLIPVSLVYPLGRLGGMVYNRLSPGVSMRIRKGLAGLSGIEGLDCGAVTRRCLNNYILNELEVFLFPRINSGNVHRFVEVEGEEHLRKALEKGRGVVLIHAHFGNAHMLMPALGYRGYKVNQVGMMPTDIMERIGEVIKRRPDERVAFWLRMKEEYEKTLPVNFIYLKSSMRPVIECLRRNEVLAISGDAGEGGGTVELEFMGRRAVFMTGPFRIAAQTGAEVLTGFVVRGRGGRHRLIIEKPDAGGPDGKDAAEGVKGFVRTLEGYFRRYPCHYARLLGYDVPPFKTGIA